MRGGRTLTQNKNSRVGVQGTMTDKWQRHAGTEAFQTLNGTLQWGRAFMLIQPGLLPCVKVPAVHWAGVKLVGWGYLKHPQSGPDSWQCASLSGPCSLPQRMVWMQEALQHWQLQTPGLPFSHSALGYHWALPYTTSLTVMCPAGSCFSAFVLAVPSTWNTLPFHQAC